MQMKSLPADVSLARGERAVIARITTDACDREGDVLIPAGMRSVDYEKNPIVFHQHDYSRLPVGWTAALSKGAHSVTAKVVFAERPEDHPAGLEWLPDTLYSLSKQGVMKGFSVGFNPLKSRAATERDRTTYGAGCRQIITDWDLLELSCAALPCNPDALALAVSKGMTPISRRRKPLDHNRKVLAAQTELKAAGVPPCDWPISARLWYPNAEQPARRTIVRHVLSTR